MDELVKSVTNKITRDAAYFVGGGTKMVSVWLSCESSTVTSGSPAIIQVFLAGLAYVLGFLVQGIFSLSFLVFNGPFHKARSFVSPPLQMAYPRGGRKGLNCTYLFSGHMKKLENRLSRTMR